MASPDRKMQRSQRALNRPKKNTFATLLEDQLRDPAFRVAWETLEPKRRVVAALLRLRAEANLSQKALAEKAGWHPAFVSRLEAFPIEGEKLYMPDLATLETYAAACGYQLGLVFARPSGRGARIEVAATAAFGDHRGFRRTLAALTRAVVKVTRGGRPALEGRRRVTEPAARQRG
jgi:transcriptional regulator with XRE-family HTH domain